MDEEVFKSPFSQATTTTSRSGVVREIARRIEFEEKQARERDSSLTSAATKSEALNVYLRIRPNPTKNVTAEMEIDEEGSGSEMVYRVDESVQMLDQTTVSFHTSRMSISNEDEKYTFNHVFGQSSNQQEIFNVTTKPLIDSMFTGIHALLYAYGVTNAGKTYTIMGELAYGDETKKIVNMNEGSEGIIPRVLQDIFNRVKNDNQYKVTVSYYELYHDKIYDLLNSDVIELRKPLKICADSATGKQYIKDLTQLPISSPQEGKGLLMEGNQRRQVSGTTLNRDSSRSHAIFAVSLMKKKPNSDAMSEISKISLVDLAGIERASKTQAQGSQLREAGYINKSLMTLARCLSAIAERQKNPNSKTQIPYRESEFTKIFKNEFNGTAKVCMIVNVSPAMKDAEETANVLKYAQTARTIKASARNVPQTYTTRPAANMLSPRLYTPSRTPGTMSKVRSAAQKKNIASATRLLHYSDDTVTTTIQPHEHVVDPMLIEEVKRQLMNNEDVALVSRIAMERSIREEVAQEIFIQMEEMEDEHRKALQDVVQRTEERYMKKIETLQKEGNDQRRLLDQAESEINDLEDQIQTLKDYQQSNEQRALELTREVDHWRSIADGSHAEQDIEAAQRKLSLQRKYDAKADEAAQYKRYQRENEFLTKKVSDLEAQLEQMRSDHKQQMKKSKQESADKLEQLRLDLNEIHSKDKEQFEQEIKDKYYEQFESKYLNDTEDLRKQFNMLQHMYDKEANEKKTLLDALKEFKQAEVTNEPSTPTKRGSIISSITSSVKKSVSKIMHSPRRSSSIVTSAVPLHASPENLRKQVLGKKRKSAVLEQDENDEAPKKKPRVTDPEMPKSPKKIQSIAKNTSPMFDVTTQPEAKLMTPPKQTKSLITYSPKKSPSPSPAKPVMIKRATRTRKLRLLNPNTKHLLEASPEVKAKTTKKTSKRVESDEEEVVKPKKRQPSRVTRKRVKEVDSSESDDDDRSGSYQPSEDEPSPSPKPVRRGRGRTRKAK